MTERCVFCNEPIGPDDERTGRGETAAHSACADRALADDAHWDAIADASPPEEPATPARAGGCFAIVALVLVVAVVIAAASGFAPV